MNKPYFETKFNIDSLPGLILAGIQYEGNYWNGWAQPLVKYDEVGKLAEKLKETEDEVQIISHPKNGNWYLVDFEYKDVEEIPSIIVEGDKYFNISFGWVWVHEGPPYE